ncbi:MAG TPA: hypothetical protein VL358_01310 [Caulobacteraceae bacterium]|jgi:hypothetical protein|nr:hypothetical protein [Caulobacteraceae bacterium]
MSLPAEAGEVRIDQRGNGAARGLGRIVAGLGAAAAVALAAVLTLIFAATLAVAVVLSAALISVYAVTHRRRPRGVLIEARRVGHSWVAYGWDQRPR